MLEHVLISNIYILEMDLLTQRIITEKDMEKFNL